MSRNIAIVAAVLFAVSYGTNTSTPLLVVYRADLALSDSMTQLIFVVYVGGTLVTLMLSGQVSDRFGRRPAMVFAVIAAAVASGLMVLGQHHFVLLLAGRVLYGVVAGTAFGVGAAWLQELSAESSGARAALVTTIMTYGGFGAGPAMSALLEQFVSDPLTTPYVVHIALVLLCLPLLSAVPETVRKPPTRSPLHSWRPRLAFGIPKAVKRHFRWIVAPVAIWIFGFPSTSFSLFPVLVADAVGNAEVAVAGAAGMLTAWSGLAARPVLKRLAARTSLTLGVSTGAVGYGLGTLALATDIWPLVLPAAAALGAASGIISAAGLLLISEMADPASRGALTSTLYLLAYVGMAMPLIVSLIADHIGAVATLSVVTLLAAMTASSGPLRHRLAEKP